MPNHFNKTRVFRFLTSEHRKSKIGTRNLYFIQNLSFRFSILRNWNQNVECSLLENIRFLESKLSEIGNRRRDFNIPPKKGFSLFDFRSRESETLNRSLKIDKKGPGSPKNPQKTRFTEEIYSIQTKWLGNQLNGNVTHKLWTW